MTLSRQNVEDRRILILGAGRGQVGLIRAANELGLRSVVASLPSSTAPGLPIAAEIVHVDITDEEGVLNAARERGVNAIATSCADTGLPALGHACDTLMLPGLTARAAQICADKGLMKCAFMEGGVTTAAYEVVRDLDELRQAATTLGLPVIIKATDLQGSKGIVIVREQDALDEAFTHVMEMTTQDGVIVEQFIEGLEFGAQALVQDGRILFTLLHNDGVHLAKTAIPVLHSVPFTSDAAFHERATFEIEKAIHAIGLDNCAVNVDLIARGDEVFIIELTGRVGANGLPEMVSKYFGVNYDEVVVRLALGEPIVHDWSQSEDRPAVVVKMVIAPDHFGVISSLEVDDQVVPEAAIQLFRRSGDELAGFSHSGDCIGQITVAAETLEAAEDRVALAERAIDIRLV